MCAINLHSKIEQKTRDGQRIPMQWTSNKINAAFTDASKPYHPLSKSWKTINLENQLNTTRSHLKVFKQLVKLREKDPFYSGKSKLILANKQIYSFIRWSNKPISVPIYLIIINMVGASRNDQQNQYVTTDFIK